MIFVQPREFISKMKLLGSLMVSESTRTSDTQLQTLDMSVSPLDEVEDEEHEGGSKEDNDDSEDFPISNDDDTREE